MPTHALKTIAQEVLDQFEQKTRKDGDKETPFWAFRDTRPQWMADLSRAAHYDGEMSPCDIRYEYIVDSLQAIAESDDDASESAIESLRYGWEADVYHYELLKWVGSHLTRSWYCDQVLEGRLDSIRFYQVLAEAQIMEKEEVFQSVLSSLRLELDNRPDDDEEDEEQVSS